MKLLICLLLFVNPSLNFDFKKDIMPYPIAISKAALIVDGVISKVSKDKYEFTVTQFIKGKSASKIGVTIWKEWTCDNRISELKSGQRLLLILEKTAGGDFKAINDSTGELFVEKNNTVTPSMYMLEKFPNATIIKKGITMYLETYTFQEKKGCFEKKKSSTEINKMKNDNKFFKYLVDDEMRYYTVK
jgi:hypothetical protein